VLNHKTPTKSELKFIGTNSKGRDYVVTMYISNYQFKIIARQMAVILKRNIENAIRENDNFKKSITEA